MMEVLVPVRREQVVIAASFGVCALIAVGLTHPSGGDLLLFTIVAVGYALFRSRRSPLFTGDAPLGDRRDLEPYGRLLLRTSFLVAPPIALMFALALLGLSLATVVVAGLIVGYALHTFGGREIRRMERRYAVVFARQAPRSLRPTRYVHRPWIVPLDDARVPELIRDGIASQPLLAEEG